MEKRNIIIKRIILAVVIISVLVAAFFIGGNAVPQKAETDTAEEAYSAVPDSVQVKEKNAGDVSDTPQAEPSAKKTESSIDESPAEKKRSAESAESVSSIPYSKASKESVHTSSSVQQNSAEYNERKADETTQENTELPEPDRPPQQSETKKVITSEQQISIVSSPQSSSYNTDDYNYSCTLYVDCKTAVNSDKLSRSTRSVLPSDGVVIPVTVQGFNEGDSAFDVLKKACGSSGIHLDFTSIPMTGGTYIRGINNLYEFDCGNVSGWMYKVNGEFPNVGCSEYKLKDGDSVEFLYSCDLGADIGNVWNGS